MPRDRNSSFEPQTVRKGQRRLDGLAGNVISLYAKGMTTGDIQAHLAEIYGTEVSRDTISRITDAVVEDMVAWQNRPLDAVYPVLLIDAVVTATATCWACGSDPPAERVPSSGWPP